MCKLYQVKHNIPYMTTTYLNLAITDKEMSILCLFITWQNILMRKWMVSLEQYMLLSTQLIYVKKKKESIFSYVVIKNNALHKGPSQYTVESWWYQHSWHGLCDDRNFREVPYSQPTLCRIRHHLGLYKQFLNLLLMVQTRLCSEGEHYLWPQVSPSALLPFNHQQWLQPLWTEWLQDNEEERSWMLIDPGEHLPHSLHAWFAYHWFTVIACARRPRSKGASTSMSL